MKYCQCGVNAVQTGYFEFPESQSAGEWLITTTLVFVCPICGVQTLTDWTGIELQDLKGTPETLCQHGDFYRIRPEPEINKAA